MESAFLWLVLVAQVLFSFVLFSVLILSAVKISFQAKTLCSASSCRTMLAADGLPVLLKLSQLKTMTNAMSPAEQIAFWADKLRDLSATGLEYANNDYDKIRYEIIQNMAIEMLAFATAQPLENLLPLQSTIFSRMSPVVAGSAAVIDKQGKILLMRRSDNQLWAMPAGQMEVGETPANAVVRETYEETGIRCIPKALVGIYDSRIWDKGVTHHVYKFTFLCEPCEEQSNEPFDTHETLEIGWFDENSLPENLYEGHYKRISDSYKARNGNFQAHFDWQKTG